MNQGEIPEENASLQARLPNAKKRKRCKRKKNYVVRNENENKPKCKYIDKKYWKQYVFITLIIAAIAGTLAYFLTKSDEPIVVINDPSQDLVNNTNTTIATPSIEPESISQLIYNPFINMGELEVFLVRYEMNTSKFNKTLNQVTNSTFDETYYEFTSLILYANQEVYFQHFLISPIPDPTQEEVQNSTETPQNYTQANYTWVELPYVNCYREFSGKILNCSYPNYLDDEELGRIFALIDKFTIPLEKKYYENGYVPSDGGESDYKILPHFYKTHKFVNKSDALEITLAYNDTSITSSEICNQTSYSQFNIHELYKTIINATHLSSIITESTNSTIDYRFEIKSRAEFMNYGVSDGTEHWNYIYYLSQNTTYKEILNPLEAKNVNPVTQNSSRILSSNVIPGSRIERHLVQHSIFGKGVDFYFIFECYYMGNCSFNLRSVIFGQATDHAKYEFLPLTFNMTRIHFTINTRVKDTIMEIRNELEKLSSEIMSNYTEMETESSNLFKKYFLPHIQEMNSQIAATKDDVLSKAKVLTSKAPPIITAFLGSYNFALQNKYNIDLENLRYLLNDYKKLLNYLNSTVPSTYISSETAQNITESLQTIKENIFSELEFHQNSFASSISEFNNSVLALDASDHNSSVYLQSRVSEFAIITNDLSTRLSLFIASNLDEVYDLEKKFTSMSYLSNFIPENSLSLNHEEIAKIEDAIKSTIPNPSLSSTIFIKDFWAAISKFRSLSSNFFLAAGTLPKYPLLDFDKILGKTYEKIETQCYDAGTKNGEINTQFITQAQKSVENFLLQIQSKFETLQTILKKMEQSGEKSKTTDSLTIDQVFDQLESSNTNFRDKANQIASSSMNFLEYSTILSYIQNVQSSYNASYSGLSLVDSSLNLNLDSNATDLINTISSTINSCKNSYTSAINSTMNQTSILLNQIPPALSTIFPIKDEVKTVLSQIFDPIREKPVGGRENIGSIMPDFAPDKISVGTTIGPLSLKAKISFGIVADIFYSMEGEIPKIDFIPQGGIFIEASGELNLLIAKAAAGIEGDLFSGKIHIECKTNYLARKHTAKFRYEIGSRISFYLGYRYPKIDFEKKCLANDRRVLSWWNPFSWISSLANSAWNVIKQTIKIIGSAITKIVDGVTKIVKTVTNVVNKILSNICIPVPVFSWSDIKKVISVNIPITIPLSKYSDDYIFSE